MTWRQAVLMLLLVGILVGISFSEGRIVERLENYKYRADSAENALELTDSLNECRHAFVGAVYELRQCKQNKGSSVEF